MAYVRQQRMSVTCDARYPLGYKQVVMRFKAWTDRTGGIPGVYSGHPGITSGTPMFGWVVPANVVDCLFALRKSFSHEGKPVSQCEMGFQTPREILACFGKFDTIIFQW